MGVTRRINKPAFQQEKVKSNAVSQASLEFGPSGFVCVPFPFADMFPDEFLAVLCVVVGVPGVMVELRRFEPTSEITRVTSVQAPKDEFTCLIGTVYEVLPPIVIG